MPNVIACFKWVIDEAYVKASSSGELSFDRVDYKISDYDKNAIEEAVRIREQHGGDVAAVTIGMSGASKGVKDALSRGADRVFFVSDPSLAGAEPLETASILAEVIRTRTEFDLVICGEGSSDLYAQQVGPALAEMLDLPSICNVSKLFLSGKQVEAERKVEDGVEIINATLPVLITVAPDINTPRIPGMKDTLGAAKKPVINIELAELKETYAPTLETVGMKAAAMERNGLKFSSDPEGISAFVSALVKTGML
ncbi:MAG: electron transfer flavoprotein subunit beta/FixA family protein [Chitinophagales bacterium]